MTHVRDLYQHLILEHGRRPRNFRTLAGDIVTAEQCNVTCGDRIRIALALDCEVIRDAAFQGAGCAISMASASLLTEAVKGRSRAAALWLGDRLTALVSSGSEQLAADTSPDMGDLGDLGDLAALVGVARFPVRIACATLAWLALGAALKRPI